MEDVKGRTAFITGGARGIGLGIAGALARAGIKLAIADIDPDSLAAAKSELAKLTAVETFKLDVRDREAYARVADEAEARLGAVSILCNNAGVAAATRFTYEFWDWMLGINLNGVINGIQTFVPRMLALRHCPSNRPHWVQWSTRAANRHLRSRGSRQMPGSLRRVRWKGCLPRWGVA